MSRLPELDQIAAFLAVAEELNFRRAAQRLAIDQSALSRRIKSLEDRLGFALLFRTTHDVRLTDAGKSFYDANREVLGALGAAVDRAARVARGASGRLRVGYMTFAAVALMPRAVRRFQNAFPDVAIDLHYQPSLLQKMSLARGEIDVGLMLGPLDHSDFALLTLAQEPLCVVAPAAHAWAAKAALTLADLAEEPMILGQLASWDFYRSRIEEIFALKGVRPLVAFEASDLFAILGLVQAGLGVTVLPETMCAFGPASLIARRLTDAEPTIQTIAAWRRPADALVKRFIELLPA